jgi:hypothetical protein
MSLKCLTYFIRGCLFLSCIGWIIPVEAADPGFLEGRLKIISSREVDLADGTPPSATAEIYTEYPLIILSQDRKQEIKRVTADRNGNYRVELPPGDYVLDVQRRPRSRVRTTPQPFTVASGQTVHLDLDLDMGIR